MNISSIVVKTLPEHVQSVIENLTSENFCEVHFHDATGRIIVTIEGEDISEEIRKLKLIQGLPRVLSASLAYAYSEREIDLARKHLTMIKDAVPDTLKE